MIPKNSLDASYFSFFFIYVRSLWKWLLRKLTGKCELLRIQYSNAPSLTKTKAIERSLQYSRKGRLRAFATVPLDDLDEAVRYTIDLKVIASDVFPSFLVKEVEQLRSTHYDSNNPSHEKLLLQLWDLMMGDVELKSRISEQWGQLGFQGHDPMTDFRGMGFLGLLQLIYFAEHYPNKSKEVFGHSSHPTMGFSYAITGINISNMAYELLVKGKLRNYVYSLPFERDAVVLLDYHRFYCYLFCEFDKLWSSEKPRDIMEFPRIRNKLKTQEKLKLKSPSFSVDIC